MEQHQRRKNTHTSSVCVRDSEIENEGSHDLGRRDSEKEGMRREVRSWHCGLRFPTERRRDRSGEARQQPSRCCWFRFDKEPPPMAAVSSGDGRNRVRSVWFAILEKERDIRGLPGTPLMKIVYLSLRDRAETRWRRRSGLQSGGRWPPP